jgi:hypothetical protein
MKKLPLVLLIAVMLAAGASVTLSVPCQAQFIEYQAPPPNAYAQPWVGPNTPWTYYNGDWFLNGILYYFFGPQYGWAPYYSYAPTYIVRPNNWYAPYWQTWYSGHPAYWNHFRQAYPYWSGHREGRRYDERFYEQHQHGKRGDWHKGFRGHPAPPPGPGHFTPPGGIKPGPLKPLPGAGPGHEAPHPGPKPGPGHVTPAPGPRPTHVTPPAGPRPAPTHVAPPARPRPSPAAAPKAAHAPKAAPGAAHPEKGGQGEEKH